MVGLSDNCGPSDSTLTRDGLHVLLLYHCLITCTSLPKLLCLQYIFYYNNVNISSFYHTLYSSKALPSIKIN